MKDRKGLRWLKCDFHLHTPASKCFEGICTAEEYVAKVKEKKIDVIAITDHNNAEWVDRIKEEAEKNNVIVFPGVEITCGESEIHCLVLFDINKTKQDIEDFLINLGMSRDDFAVEGAYINKTIEELLNEVKKINGLLIPAHIDTYKGLNKISNEKSRNSFLSDEFINGVQIVNQISNTKVNLNKDNYCSIKTTEDNRDFTKIANTINQVNNNNLSKLTFSDNPKSENDSKHGLWGIGNQYTWIKMKEKPDLESLRQALIMREYRVKNIFDSKELPYRTPNIWIEKIEIFNTELNNDVIVANFNPQMTNIIGGRGTGKSSILSVIRGGLNQKPVLEGIKKEFDDFYRKNNKKLGKGIFKEESKINIYIGFNNERYKVEKTFNTVEELKLFKYYGNSYILEENLDIFSFFNIEAYSQKEIYELANKSNYLLEVIDSSIEDISHEKKGIQILKSDYRQLYLEIERIKKIEETLSLLKTVIELEENKLKKINSEDYTILLDEKEKYEKENKIIEKLKGGYSKIEEIIPNNFGEIEVEKGSEEFEKLNSGIIEEIESIEQELVNFKEKVRLQKANYLKKIEESEWKSKHDTLKNQLRKEEEKISEEIGTLDLKSINEKIKLKKEEYSQSKEQIKNKENLIKEKEKLFEAIKGKRKKIFDLRKKHLDQVLKDTGVKIKINEYRDKKDFELKFRKIISRETEFSNDINELKEDLFQGLYIKKREKLIEKIDDAREGKSGFHSKLNEVLKGLNNENMADIELLLPEDEIKIEYKKNDSYQSLSKASAGQKTSAILTYILSKGNTPLILDQPEDDLDNELIYNLIVENLKRSKAKRQVIVVTHNANIPVNGDSEYVVIMDSESKDINVKLEGSIDNKEVISSICNIMEGGKTAFDLRGKKYK